VSRIKVSIIHIFIENNNELTKRKFKYIDIKSTWLTKQRLFFNITERS
jgi:hypothetical protein